MSSLLLAITLLALLGAAAIAIVQHALLECSRGRLEEMAEKSSDRTASKRVKAILDDLTGHYSALGFWRVVTTFVFVIAGADWAIHLAPIAQDGASLLGLSPMAALVLVGLLLAFWLFTVALPTSIAEYAPERAILSTSRPLRLTHASLAPVRGPLRLLDEGVRRLAGPADQTPAEQLEQEILDVVEEHGLSEEIGEEELDMLEKVVEFRSTSVEQVMTPRTDVQAIAYSDDLDTISSHVNDLGHSRIPVFKDNLDHIVGVLYAKDLLRWIISHGNNGRPFILSEILRPVIFIPESKTIRELLTELLARQVHVAMVADEYGGTAGLITIEDIIEEIFGEIADEYDHPDEATTGVQIDKPNNAAVIDAKAAIDDVNDLLEPLSIELPESDLYDTVGGFVVGILGRIPQSGDTFEHLTESATLTIEILEAEPTRVKRIRVSRQTQTDAPADRPIEREAG